MPSAILEKRNRQRNVTHTNRLLRVRTVKYGRTHIPSVRKKHTFTNVRQHEIRAILNLLGNKNHNSPNGILY